MELLIFSQILVKPLYEDEKKHCSLKISELTINSRSDIIAPNVIDITGPINGDTNIAATIFDALFSINPNAAKELKWINFM
jgi:hypothetical protein